MLRHGPCRPGRPRRAATVAAALAASLLLVTGVGVTRGAADRRDLRDDDPQLPRRWLRPDRPHRDRGDGGRRDHRPALEVFNVDRRRRHGRPARDWSTRRATSDLMTDGPRRRRCGLHEQVDAPLQADDRRRSPSSSRSTRASWSRRTRPFKTIDDLVAAWKEDPDSVVIGGGSLPRRSRPPVPDAAGQGRRHRPQATCDYVAVRRRWPAPPPCSATRSTSASPASASSRTRSPTATSGCSPCPASERLEGEGMTTPPP